MRGDAGVRVRRMSAADLERVMELAESLKEAPQWPRAAYVCALDPEAVPRRVALVAEDAADPLHMPSEDPEKRPSGTKAHVLFDGSPYGLKPVPFTVMSSSGTRDEVGSGLVVGFLIARLLAPEAELETIGVATEGQRRGTGRRLLGAMVEELREAGVHEAILEVRASNQAALRFYRELGWRETGRRQRYYADPEEDAVLMSLRLD
jgi:ribosomal-protein-alanine N-acetyltransferase